MEKGGKKVAWSHKTEGQPPRVTKGLGFAL